MRHSLAACLMATPPRRPHLAQGGAAVVPLEQVQPAVPVMAGVQFITCSKSGQVCSISCSAEAIVRGMRWTAASIFLMHK